MLERNLPMTRPKVLLNFAMSVDGKVTTVGHAPSGFTSAHDKKRLLEIRSLGDALIVGRKTLITDNMSMGMPDEALRKQRLERGQSEYPIRVILTRSGSLPDDLKIFRHNFSPILIYSTDRMPEPVQAHLQMRARVHLFDESQLTPDHVLKHLVEHYRVKVLVCEGGPTLAKAFAEIDAIDELYITIAPRLFGGYSAPGILGAPGPYLATSRKYRLVSMEIVANECYVHYAADR
jgi:2,5-diamino-6-(ribosylamino)-4(3H)-pyrimidinone 5'-phosphate reductase